MYSNFKNVSLFLMFLFKFWLSQREIILFFIFNNLLILFLIVFNAKFEIIISIIISNFYTHYFIFDSDKCLKKNMFYSIYFFPNFLVNFIKIMGLLLLIVLQNYWIIIVFNKYNISFSYVDLFSSNIILYLGSILCIFLSSILKSKSKATIFLIVCIVPLFSESNLLFYLAIVYVSITGGIIYHEKSNFF